MAQLKDLLVEGKSRFIDKIYASDQFISTVAQGTSPFVISSSTLVSNLNADLVDGQHFNYSNTSNSPTYLWGTSSNGTNYLVSRANMHAGIADKITTVTRSTDAWHYPTFVDSDNSTATEESLYTAGGLRFNPSTRAIAIGTTSTASGSGAIAAGTYATADGTNAVAIGGYVTAIGSGAFARGTFVSAAHGNGISTAFGSNWAWNVNLTGDANVTSYTCTPAADSGMAELLAKFWSTHSGSIKNAFILGGRIYDAALADVTITNMAYSNGTLTFTFSRTLSATAISNKTYYIICCIAGGEGSFVNTGFVGQGGKWSLAGGRFSMALGDYGAISYGHLNIAGGGSSAAFGNHTLTYNNGEFACGSFNNSTSGSTKFSVGIGSADNARKNAFEIVSNGNAFLNGVFTINAPAYSANATWTYPGGSYASVASPNIRLIGDPTYGLSTIEFISQKGETSINKPSDCAFIQFQPYGTTTQSAVGSQPTLASSGELNRLVIGVNNDSTDTLVLQTPSTTGLKHAVGTGLYTIWDSGNDGSGSGLDADLLDGKHASDFSLAHSHPYLPLAGGTMTGTIYSGSGLVQIWRGSATSGSAGYNTYLAYSGGNIYLATYGSTNTGKTIYLETYDTDLYHRKNLTNYKIWDEGNDGSGSGLDADLLDGYHGTDFLLKLRRLNEVFEHSSYVTGMFPPALFELKSAGYPVYTDPEFASGTNSVNVYNNSGGGTVTITREQAGDHANSSGYQLKIVTNGTASPGAGGFYQSISSRANAVFVQIFRAKVPVGYNVTTASNSMGTSYQDKFITSRAGTGKWEWYARVVYCGASGTFSSGGHVYLSANSGYSATSVTWYLSYCNLIDITKGAYDGLRTRYADSADSISSWAESSGTDYRYVWHSGTGNAAKAAYKSSLTFCPNTGDLKVTSLNANDSTGYTKIYPGYIQIRKNTAANPTANYASIEFSYGSGQNVYIGYTPNDSYRAPAGLKVFGGSGATPAWFEVEGQIISSVATGTAPFIVTSTTKVANLYADKADTATRLVSNNTMTYGLDGLNYFNINASNQSAAKVNDTPYSSATWTHILRFNHANNGGYYTDLAVPFNANGMYYKRIQNGALQNANTNGGWVGLLDVLNYSNYAQTYITQEGAVNHFGQHVTVESTVTKDPANNGYYATGTLRRISQMNFNGYTVWTVSGYFKAASAITVNINLCDKTSNSVYGENSSSVSLTTSYVYHKFTYDNVNQYNTSSAYNGFLDIEGSSDVVVYVKDLMIEHGYVAHEWRPSLSDSTTKVKTITNSTNSSHYLTFVDSNNSSATEETLYTSSKLTINPSTGYIGINVTNPSSPIDASGGYLKVTYNGNTLSIGSGNTSFTHFSNSASREFYFSNAMTVNGNLRPYVTKSFSSGTTSSRWTKVYVTDGLDSSGALNLTSAANTAINFIQGTATNMALSTAGVLTLKANVYTDTSVAGSLNLQNSNIYGINSLIFADACENGAEGIQFYRDATHADTIWDAGGILYYAPNRPYGSAGTSYKIWHEGNDGSGSGLDADLLDGYHASNFAVNTSKHYTSVDTMTADSSAWYNIFTISDSTSGAALCIIKAYAHSSLTFVVSKGYSTTTTLQILEYNYSGNASYFYVKGVRILSDGKVQALFNKTSGASTYINVDINIFSANGSLKPNDTLTLETATLDTTTTPSVCISLLGTHKKMTTDIVGSSTKIQTVKCTTNVSHYLTFVDSNNDSVADESLYTSDKIAFNPSTGNLGLGTTSPSQKLHVIGNIYCDSSPSSNASKTNYVSAGPGYSTAAGKYGVKVVSCDQSDCQSGLGQDLGMVSGWSGWENNYNLSIAGGNNSSDVGKISFVSHKVNSTTYRYLGGFLDTAGTIKFNVQGTGLFTGSVGIGTNAPENKLDVNGIASIYPRGADNTAFKGNLIIKQQNSTEDTGQDYTGSKPSFGIQFNRFWTSNGNPSGETAGAGIFATVSSSWRSGLVFRTKNNQTQGGTHDTNALRLRPDGNTVLAGGIGSSGTKGNVTGAYIDHPAGGCYATNTSSVTGYLKITLPQKGKNTMMSFDVTIYTYDGANQSYTTYHISGYEYSTNGWYEPVTKVYSEGIGPYTNLAVRLGNDGTYACVTIGESNTVWTYPQVTIHNIMTGYSNAAVDTWIGGWSVDFTTTALTTIVATRSSVNTQNINISGNADTVDGKHASEFATSGHTHSTYVLKAGDTMSGQLYINYDQDVGLNQNGSIVIGNKAGENIAIDANEIMARNNSSASTLYLNNEGGNIVSAGSGNFGIGTSSPSQKLHVSGNIYSTGKVFVNNTTTALGADNTSVVWLANSSGYPLVASANVVRRGASLATGQLGDSTYPWAEIHATKHKTANYELSESTNSRLSVGNAGQSVAKGLNVGDLLVSSAWADYTKVPTNGIYSKGQIKSGVAQGTAPLAVDSSTQVTNLKSNFAQYADVLRDPVYYTSGSRRSSGNITFADGGLHYFLATSSMSAANGKPAADGHILHMAWDNSKYDAQLTLPTSSTGAMQWRVQTNGTDASWTPWKTVIDSSNIGTYAAAANHTHAYIKGSDNRNTNNAPSWYMSNPGSASVYTEFAQSGGAVASTYENRVTFTPWGDQSGQRPVQLAFNNTGMYMRTSSSDSVWNSWNKIALNATLGTTVAMADAGGTITVEANKIIPVTTTNTTTVTFSFAWTGANNCDIAHILITGSGSSKMINIGDMSTGTTKKNVQAILVTSGGFGEISILYANSTYYIRAVGS